MTLSHRSTADGFAISGHGVVVTRRASLGRPVGRLVLGAVSLVAGSAIAVGTQGREATQKPFPPVAGIDVQLRIVNVDEPNRDPRGSRPGKGS